MKYEYTFSDLILGISRNQVPAWIRTYVFHEKDRIAEALQQDKKFTFDRKLNDRTDTVLITWQ